MKKIFTFFALLAMVGMNAMASDLVTMDVTTAKDMLLKDMTFNNDVWDKTYDETQQVFYTNNGLFSLSHLPSGNSYGGCSWEGFTAAKIASDTVTTYGFECAAKGGLKGVGTPYVVGYFSEYYSNNNVENIPSSNIVYFGEKDNVYPTEVYITNTTYTMQYVATTFQATDTFSIEFRTMNLTTFKEGVEVVKLNLAVGKEAIGTWTKVDLSSLGSCMAISVKMTSTDAGQWGINTPTYFCMDGLQYSKTPLMTSISNVNVAKAEKIMQNGQLVIIKNGIRYNAAGQIVR